MSISHGRTLSEIKRGKKKKTQKGACEGEELKGRDIQILDKDIVAGHEVFVI